MTRPQLIQIIFALLIYSSIGCGSDASDVFTVPQNYQLMVEQHRAETQKYFSGKESPLPDSVKADFQGVRYFPVDTNFRVIAYYRTLKNEPVFEMPVSGDIADLYQTVGELSFSIHDTICELQVYLNKTLLREKGQMYYFVPFNDKSNSKTTYGGGRYLDFEKVTEGEMVLDFNYAYQPYCFYNHEYSCPIPPALNALPVYVQAGEKM